MEDMIPICMVWKKRDQNPLLPIVAEQLRLQLDGKDFE
jgi:hypothetical protein